LKAPGTLFLIGHEAEKYPYVVLFHGTYPHAVEVLPGLVALARERALAFTTIHAWTT
jgi:hypothetical protein